VTRLVGAACVDRRSNVGGNDAEMSAGGGVLTPAAGGHGGVTFMGVFDDFDRKRVWRPSGG
jgi:hypothetical protein